ncbi:hypothetical protein LEM8419_00053 [Neolewinella maritima]|uniref:Tetratricopeptide repeat protein n=1 Tax=Neolewinella maritima TaxID=1383882 RepID=A0ABM9AWC2_9BACT|nr:hypothetical protein [Neolewinella maritima]CAH0998707.1 hypothetical protein LEM8419_00053 [Neolewinella maritima]
MQDGRHLAELLAYHRQYRADYLEWAAARGYPEQAALHNYRRALVGWYEASMDPTHPYRGEVLYYVTALAATYFGAPPPQDTVPLGDNPLDHLPRTVQLDAGSQQLLTRLQALPEADRELLLLADYHRLDPPALLRALDGEDEDPDVLTDPLEDTRARAGLDGPAAELLWPSVITVAGRQDLLATLQSAAPATPQTSSDSPVRTNETSDVSLTRRAPAFNWPSAGIVLAGALFGVLLYLAYTTFGGATTGSLYTKYFEPYPNIFTVREPATEDERDLQRILYYYDRGEYRTAYDELLPTAAAYPAAPLYLGVTALALNDPARAREWLAELPDQSPHRPAAQWYDALAQLGQGGAAGAKHTLQAIAAAPDHPYRRQAQQLLSDL